MTTHGEGLPHFSVTELACRHCGKLELDKDAGERLERLRLILGKPVVVLSGYRCPEHNAAVGGAKGSLHMKGRAFDLYYGQSAGFMLWDVFKAAEMAGFTGFGFYPRFIHVDTGAPRMWA